MSVPTYGSEFIVNTTITGFNQTESSVTALTNGYFIVTFTDDSAASLDTSSKGVYGQILDATGAAVGAAFLVNDTTANEQQDAHVIALSGGRFAVVWVDGSQIAGANAYDIRAKIFNADGSVAVAEMVVDASPTGLQLAPAIAELSDGSFVVTWTDGDLTLGDASNQAIHGQHFTSAGAPSGSEFLVNTTVSLDQAESSVTGLANGGFVVTWTDNSQTGGDTNSGAIRGKVFTTNSSTTGTEFLINTTTAGNQRESAVTALEGGGFVVTWTDGSATGADTDGSAIRGRVFDSSGNALANDFVINATTTSGQEHSAIAALPDGRFVVVWADNSQSSDDSDQRAIRAQVFNANGSVSVAEFLVNATTVGDQFDPQVSVLADGRFVVTWTDTSATGADTSGAAIRSQIFDPRTAPVTYTAPATGIDYVGTTFDDSLTGDIGADSLHGNAGADTLYGDIGYDVLSGDDGADLLIGGRGFDTLYGGADNDLLAGWAGDDRLDGGTGDDSMFGAKGNDVYVVDSLGDRVYETQTDSDATDLGGYDRVESSVSFALAAYTGVSFVEDLTLTGTADIDGTGNRLANLMYGNSGNNVLSGWAGNDTIRGEAGADLMNGNVGDDLLQGGDGNDTIRGGKDNDTLRGDDGNDVLYGDLGQDLFVFKTALNDVTNVDTLGDFSVADDTIALDNDIMTGLGLTTGAMSAALFAANTSGDATTAGQRVIYDIDDGKLYYDADGSGAGAKMLFANLSTGLALTAADFIIV
ncbi:calcium-binding protein [Frigidibacter sp. RF13]|uniref:calcium-binding protein n=1 Tax=Frigidibacter sp. RF13 TaxID=2997340 RepID=UPI00227035B8|nr:calcium-binding protein [Frigidibacter sp. RF13]MCY1126914.1 calcium-binding protein [Frigidibacter sp. RF13]